MSVSDFDVRFLVDFMLGRLCKWLRIIGYNAKYFKGLDRKEILYESLKERRIVLTRDHRLSKKKAWDIILIESDFLDEQISQLIDCSVIKIDENKLFSRCTICNTEIQAIEKESVKGKVPEYIYQTHKDFSYCQICNKIYWMGTHFEHMRNKLNKIHNERFKSA